MVTCTCACFVICMHTKLNYGHNNLCTCATMADNQPKYLIGTWGSGERPTLVMNNTDVNHMIMNHHCEFLAGGDRAARVVICTINVGTADVATIADGNDIYRFPRLCAATCAWINRCNTQYAGKQYVIYKCWMGRGIELVGDKTQHIVELMNDYETYVDEIEWYLSIARPRIMFAGRVGSHLELTPISTIDCHTKCGDSMVRVRSKTYDDSNGKTITYSLRMYADGMRARQRRNDTRYITWRADDDTTEIRDMYKWLLDNIPDATVYIDLYVEIDNNTYYQPSSRPFGPALRAFAGILTAEQIAMYGSDKPSDEPTYDADDTASDDYYGPDQELDYDYDDE